MEKPAKNTKGYLLYSPFRKKDPYFFRIYNEDGSFTDYDLNIEELEIEIISEFASFYEEGENKRIDWSSETLGKKNI